MAPQQLLHIGLLILCLTLPVKTAVSYTYFCNTVTYTNNDFFATSIDDVIKNLGLNGWNTAQNSGVFQYESPASIAKAYGSATFSSNISPIDCFNCIVAATNEVIGVCPMATGGQIIDMSPGCTIRYEKYKF